MRLNHYLTLLLALGLVVVGCGKSDEDDLLAGGGSSAGSSASAVMGTASVTGKVTLTGKAPEQAVLSFDADPVCKAQHSGTTHDESVVVDAKGNLANVLVYVKDGAGIYPSPSNGVTLLQKGCQYHPHVFGIQVNQPLEIVNGDNTLHNVHAMPVTNDAFNVGQPSQGMVTEKKFAKPEIPVKFKCDVHSWMHCLTGVFTHPFFTVSTEDGSFKINGLPAGTYTLVAYHEKYGESAPQKVDIKDGEAKTLNFAFTAQ
jgi:hypothetical protein